MDISVVIPTFRRPQLLHRCLQALSEQLLPADHFEVIVVSDGPDDSTGDAVEQWKAAGLPVSYYPLAAKKGPAAARNAGWRQAKSPVVAFTDDDCLPGPGWLLSICSYYEGQEYAACSGRIIVPVSAQPVDFERNTQGLETAAFVTANCACTKAALEKVEGFDEAFTMAWREDSDLEFRLLRQQIPVTKLEEAVVVHPVRQAPWGISMKEQKKGMFNALLYKKYPQLYRRRIEPRPPLHYYAIIASLAALVAGLLLQRTWISAAAFTLWLFFTVQFIARRLAHTSHSPRHITEMIITSLAIPFLSVFWQLYGAWKFKVLFA